MAEPIKYHLEIKPHNKWYQINLREIWQYRDLILLLVRRDYVSVYKQTILGPLWFFMQPILTTITFVIIFGNLAGISTDGMPKGLFYITGLTFWNYFASCVNGTSNTFTANASVFGKVYFPRLAVPVSIVVSNLLKFGIQLLLLIVIWLYYLYTNDNVRPNITILLLPLYLIIMAILGLGIGIVLSAFTTKYRDLTFLVAFGVQLAMYASPIVYPLSVVQEKHPEYVWLIMLNPMSSIIEAAKYGFTGSGFFSLPYLAYSLLVSLVILLIGIILFHKVEKNFMDTV